MTVGAISADTNPLADWATAADAACSRPVRVTALKPSGWHPAWRSVPSP